MCGSSSRHTIYICVVVVADIPYIYMCVSSSRHTIYICVVVVVADIPYICVVVVAGIPYIYICVCDTQGGGAVFSLDHSTPKSDIYICYICAQAILTQGS